MDPAREPGGDEPGRAVHQRGWCIRWPMMMDGWNHGEAYMICTRCNPGWRELSISH